VPRIAPGLASKQGKFLANHKPSIGVKAWRCIGASSISYQWGTKIMRYTLLVAALAATVVSPALAQQAPTATDNAQADARGVVLQAHQLLKDKDLDFGVVTVDGQGGDVSISADAAGTRSTTLGVAALSGTYQAAKFLGEAAPLETVQLTLTQLPGGTIKNTNNPGVTIPASLVLDSAGATRVTDGTGQFTVFVGGTFTLAPNQAAGVYTETFDLRADYQ
jgi:hypothetical protein